MPSQPFKFIRVSTAAFCGMIVFLVLSRVAQADEDTHAQADAFAAEAAALLPAAGPSIAAATAPAERITLGEWGAVIPWTPHIPVSAATLPDGRVLTFASNQRTTFPSGVEFTYAATWNPATGQFVEYNHPSHDMFCGGIVTLPDGRVLVNGGRNTTVRSSIFDWRVNTWTRTPDMNDPRWYNTTVALPNGRAWTVSGDGGPGTAERWDPSSGWSRQTGINWNTVLAEPGYITRWHPFLLVAPDGRLIHFGPTDTMHWVSTENSGSMTNTGTFVPGTHYPKEGSWVMYNEGRILVAGGGADTKANSGDSTTGTSSKVAYTVDVRTGTPVVASVASMTFARQFANGVVLPNGEVMIIGGNTSGLKFNDTGSILTPEIWNPTTGQWRVAADMSVPRNYHSLALLLPDGRVLSGGGGLSGNSADHQDAQLYTPPTLFNADGSLATRPVLSNAPAVIGVGTKFAVTGTAGLQKFNFIKMSAITHSVNTDLRFLPLSFSQISPGNYEITAHGSLNVMTPGYWMLFGLNASNVHSVAKIILVDSTSSVNITPPGNRTSYIGQPASLQMAGSGPTGSVLNWSATGLPTGLAINGASGLISGTPTVLGDFSVQVTLSAGGVSTTANFVWTIQPVTFSQNYLNFNNASALTLNGNAAFSGGALRVVPRTRNRVGSAFLSNPIAIGTNTSISTRWVFRIHGTADGGDGLVFIIQGNGPTSIGTGGSGLGYSGIGRSVAVEIDNNQNTGDPTANHLGILTNGNVTAHLATFTPGWDLENESSHTVWVEYDGPLNQLRVYAAQGNVAQRPANPVMTATIDLPALVVGEQAWFGFSGATSSLNNNHDIESWRLTVNAFSLPAQPLLTTPANQTNALGGALTLQMQATDPNGDLLTWSATGLPAGLSINPTSGLISGTPNQVGDFSPTVTVTDSNTLPVNANFAWTINNLLTVQPLSGTAVPAGSTVALTAQATGGLNRLYRWSFGDGTPDTAFSSSPSTSHLFSTPGRFLVTVTVRDDTGREVTSSYRQAVYAPLTASRPAASTSIAYETRTGVNSRLWVVNPDNDSVTVFDAVTRAKLAEVSVGRAPRSLALAPDGRVWVANTESASLTIIQTNFAIAQTVNLPRGSRPFGLVFDPAGQNAYVALEGTGKILKLNPTTGATIASLNVGLNVRHLSVTADSARILATRFITPRVPGEETSAPQTTVAGVKYGGEVVKVNIATFAIEGTVILEHSEQPDTSNSAHGIPNYLGAAAISPDGLSAWVPSKQDNIKRGTLRNGGVLTHDMSIRSIASRIVLATLTEDVAGRIDFDNAGIASAAAFDPRGNFLFTVLEGSREVAVADAWAKQEILRFPAGRAPQGLALSPDGRTLYVQNFMDRTISIHDLNALANGAETPPPAPVVLNCVTTEKLAANVLLGKQLFYDARDNRLALQQYISCAACHNDGGQDGRIWDFTQFGEGLRNTITLRGHGGIAQGPLHWTGNFDEVQDFEGQIRNFAGGLGLMSDTNFHAGTRSQPLGDTKAGLSADLDALAAYLSSLTKNGDSPDRNADGTFTSAALAGQSVFQQQNCAQCHAGPQFTDSALNVFHDVGTLKPSSGQRLGAALTGLDTPTLLGLWANAPYLHDGSAATLEAAVSAHNGAAINATDLSNLVAFLRQLDDGGSAAPTISDIAGQATTVNTATPAIPFTINDADTPIGNLTLSRNSSNTNLVPTNNIVFGGSGNNRTVTITPATGQTGSTTITVSVSDGALSASDTFLLTVTAVNTPPTITGIANQTINVGATTGPLAFTIGDVETAAGSLTLSPNSSNPTLVPVGNIVFGGSGANRTVTVSPAAGQSGTATITVSVSDGALSASNSFVVTVSAQVAGTQSFTNTAAITIPGVGNASPYPSVINVTGMGGTVSNVTVTLRGLTHTWPADVDVLLVGPNGQKAMIFSDVGGSTDVNNVTVTLSDAAATALTAAGTIVSGTYRPTNVEPGESGELDTFPAPAPGGPYAAPLTVFNGSAANGTWSLYAVDDGAGDQGSFASGWSLTITTVTTGSQAPTISDIADQVTTVNTPTAAIPFTVNDADTPAATLALSGNSSNTNLVPTNNIVFGGSGANRTVTVSPAAGQTGSATITVTVSDGSLTASDTFVLTVSASSGGGQTSFTNATAITIPGVGNATPYPSVINVGGLGGVVSNVTVTLRGFTHTWPADVDVLLVGPGGQKAMIFSDVGGSTDVNNVTVTLSDAAATALTATGTIVSGTYRPSNVEPGETGEVDAFGAPAPGGPYTAPLSVFNGTTPTGAWSLYVLDDGAGDAGSFGSGWSLTISTAGAAARNSISVEAPPQITSITLDGQGGIRLNVRGQVGLSYGLEASIDLANWTKVTVQDNTTGSIEFVDQPTTNAVRFYRAVSVPK